MKQLRENEQADWGRNYYDSYGISFDADVEVIRGADLNTGDEAKTKATIKRLGEIMDKSLVTVKPPHPFIRQSRLNGCGFPLL